MINQKEQYLFRITASAQADLGQKFRDPYYLRNCVSFQHLAMYLGYPEDHADSVQFDDGVVVTIERRKHGYSSGLPKAVKTFDYFVANPAEDWGFRCSAVWTKGGELLAPIRAHARFRGCWPDTLETRAAALAWMNGGHQRLPLSPSDTEE